MGFLRDYRLNEVGLGFHFGVNFDLCENIFHVPICCQSQECRRQKTDLWPETASYLQSVILLDSVISRLSFAVFPIRGIANFL